MMHGTLKFYSNAARLKQYPYYTCVGELQCEMFGGAGAWRLFVSGGPVVGLGRSHSTSMSCTSGW